MSRKTIADIANEYGFTPYAVKVILDVSQVFPDDIQLSEVHWTAEEARIEVENVILDLESVVECAG